MLAKELIKMLEQHPDAEVRFDDCSPVTVTFKDRDGDWPPTFYVWEDRGYELMVDHYDE